MKKKIKVLFLLYILFFIFSQGVVFATNETNNVSNDDILNEQQEKLGISEFIDLSEKYTEENMEDINIKEFFDSAITGKIGNTNILNNILNIFGQEFKTAITNIRYYSYYHYYT